MTWFKVDDKFPDHPKVESLEDDPQEWANSLAIWLVIGCKCNRHPAARGEISASKLARITPLGRRAVAAADALVRAGLWKKTETGYRYHDWHDYQPTPEEDALQRANNTKRQREWRQKRRLGRGGKNTPTEPQRNAVTDAVTDAVTSALVTPLSRDPCSTTPSRPVPSRPSLPTEEKEEPEFRSEPASPGPSVAEAIRDLQTRYPPGFAQELRDACALNRQRGKMADSCWLKVLHQLEAHPLPAVLEAGRTFLERHADGDKGEAYLLGIVRRRRRDTRAGVAPARRHEEFEHDDPEEVWSGTGE